jgi:hypothetical protein
MMGLGWTGEVVLKFLIPCIENELFAIRPVKQKLLK